MSFTDASARKRNLALLCVAMVALACDSPTTTRAISATAATTMMAVRMPPQEWQRMGKIPGLRHGRAMLVSFWRAGGLA